MSTHARTRFRSSRRWVALPLLLGLVWPPASGRAADAPPELAGVTTVTGTGPSSMLVSIPGDASISPRIHENPDVSAQGGGRYIGVALVAEGFEERIGPTLIAGRIHPRAICDDTGCPYGVATPVVSVDLAIERGRLVLPAGTYRLHLIAEPSAGPVSISLRLHGLAGETGLSPSEATGIKTQPLPPSVTLPQSQSVYWSGGRHDMGASNRGLMWSMVWFRHPLEPEGSYEYCSYFGKGPDPVPGCPTSDIAVAIQGGIVGYPIKAWILLEGYAFPAQGDVAQQMWFAADMTDGLDGIGVWLPFGEVGTPLPGSSALLAATWFPAPVLGQEPAAPERLVRCAPAPCDASLPASLSARA